MEARIHMFPCLTDNYGFLLHEPRAGLTAAVDTPDAEAILGALGERGWRLTHILNTHHHWDHAGGNLRLKEATGCEIIAPRREAEHIPGFDRTVDDGAEFCLGALRVRVLHTPGHTLGHVVYHLPEAEVVFVGDTLFSLGCGRLFEGSAEQLWGSLQRLLELPDATRVYCAHEYTLANARFALTVEPDNPALRARVEQVRALRARDASTIPTTLGQERRTNPFLRPDSEEVCLRLGLSGAPVAQVFAELRRRKDHFH